ncbi:DUF4304 domain-containing protein [Bacillus weihaiensis]|uniref:DUF4304 domain-containing protein n=1 Tax=Bacillus weihaiensis TaxID=1547283 RepID=UPI0023569D75|nr:DUF4304 domain-containing protein [Bacillus weihaiensis]
MISNGRPAMTNALKMVVVPYLREHGFKGSFPHFRRQNEDNIDLITFQFNRYDWSFVVELAVCTPEGVTMSWGEKIPPNKVTAYDVNDRHRLSENMKDDTDHWFNYEHAKSDEDYELVVSQVKDLLHVSDRNWMKRLFDDHSQGS